MNFIGMKPLAYYVGNYLADFLLFTIPTFGFIILLFPLGITYFIINLAWLKQLVNMLAFGVSLISMTYLFSFLFTSANNAFKQIGIIYMLIGTFLPNIITAIAAGLDIFTVIRCIFLLNPFLNFANAMNYITLMNIAEDPFFEDEKDLILKFIDKAFVFGPVFCISFNILLGIIYFILAVFIDSRNQNKFRT